MALVWLGQPVHRLGQSAVNEQVDRLLVVLSACHAVLSSLPRYVRRAIKHASASPRADVGGSLVTDGLDRLVVSGFQVSSFAGARARVAERQWDDVIRIAPPPPDTRKTQLELDDKKSGKVRNPTSPMS